MAERGAPFGVTVPKAVSFIAGTGTELAFTDLTPDELDIFDLDLIKLSKYFSQTRDLQNLFLEDRDTYLWAAAIAKKQLAKGFGGAVAGSGEFGMQWIRSKTFLGTDSWQKSYSDAGWNWVYGTSATAQVDLGSTSTTYGVPQNRVLAVFPKLYNEAVPKIREVWFHIGPSDYPTFPIAFQSLGDLYVAGLPATPLIVKNGKFYMKGNVLGIGVVDAIAPLGLAFADGEYMTQE